MNQLRVEIRERIKSELYRVIREAKDKVSGVTGQRSFSFAIFGSIHKVGNYLNKSEGWSDPGIENIARINIWLKDNGIEPIDVNWVISGEKSDSQIVLKNIKEQIPDMDISVYLP